VSLCQSKNEVADAATTLGADAAFARPRRGTSRLRGLDVNALCTQVVCRRPFSSLPPRRVSPVARRPLREEKDVHEYHEVEY